MIARMGKTDMVIKPIFQGDILLNNLTLNPLKNKNKKLHIEIPSIPVLKAGNKGESYCFKSDKKSVGSKIDNKPKIAESRKYMYLFIFLI